MRKRPTGRQAFLSVRINASLSVERLSERIIFMLALA